MAIAAETTTTEMTAMEEATVAVEMIPIDRIHAASNVRSGKLPNVEGLAVSIRRHGVLTAITLDRREDGDFDLVAGFRRLAAARLAGLTGIPAVIRERRDEADRLRRQLAENIEREGLRDLDQAAAMQQLLELGVEAEAVAETVHTTADNVRAWADLLKLPRKVRRLIDTGRLTAAETHPLVRLLDDKEAMRAALERIDAGWDVERAVRDTIRERGRKLAAARAKLDAEGCAVIDAPQFNSFASTSRTRKLGTGYSDVHVPIREHAKMPCHAAFISSYDATVVYVCTDRRRHAGIEGSGVPDLKGERAAKRAAKKALREAHAARFASVGDAVRNHAISRDVAVAHVLRWVIHEADPADHEAAVALLDLPVPEGGGFDRERDALLAHAASGDEALADVALALAVARGERALTTDRFDWRRPTVAEYATLIRATGIHEFTPAEEERIAQRGPTRRE